MAGLVADAPNQAEREKFYAQVEERDLSPLWTRTLVQSEPKLLIKSRPHLWDFDNILRPLLLEAGGLITAQEGNRRVFRWKIQVFRVARRAFLNPFMPACK